MKLLSWLLYIPVQVAAIPLAIVGAVLVGYRQLAVSKRLGVSQTAIEVFNGRWTLHIFGIRDDPGAAKLGPALPNTSTVGLWLALFPLWVKAKIAGEPVIYPRRVTPEKAGISDFVPVRTQHFDRVLARQLEQVEQFVMMGAGMDTRPYGALDLRGARVFELDQETTQRLKRDTMAKAGIDSSHVTFVTVDFSTEDPFEKLAAAGYEPGKKSLFLWEGVTLYLSEKAVRETMSAVKAGSPPGSVLLADIYGERMLEMARKKGAAETLEMTGEGLQFGMSFARDWEAELAVFVESTSFTQGETVFLGSETGDGPFMVVVEMIV